MFNYILTYLNIEAVSTDVLSVLGFVNLIVRVCFLLVLVIK